MKEIININCGICGEPLTENGEAKLGKSLRVITDNEQNWEIECPICWTLNYYPLKTYRFGENNDL